MKERIAVLTLLTDFGLKDWFAGTMKGVILGTCLRARIVDLTHEVSPGDIKAAAFAPANTVGLEGRSEGGPGAVATTNLSPSD